MCQILGAIPWIRERFALWFGLNYPHIATGDISTPSPEMVVRCEHFFYQRHPALVIPDYALQLIRRGNAIRIPPFVCGALWPQQSDGLPDPRHPEYPQGLFPYGDQVLLSLMEQKVEETTLLERYFAADLGKIFSLDEHLEHWRALLDKLDNGASFAVADWAWAVWRRRRLFWTIGHPTHEMFDFVIRRLLSLAFGSSVPPSQITAALPAAESDFLMTPIHPSVARAFQLAWFSGNLIYRHLDRFYTHREWALEYVRYILSVRAYCQQENVWPPPLKTWPGISPSGPVQNLGKAEAKHA